METSEILPRFEAGEPGAYDTGQGRQFHLKPVLVPQVCHN